MFTELLSKPDVVLFDWDNTLVQSSVAFKKVMHLVLKELSLDVSLLETEEFKQTKNKSIRMTLQSVFGERWQEVWAVYNKHFASVHLDTIIVMPGAISFLEMLIKNDTQTGIISNKDGAFLRKEVTVFGLDQYFGTIIGAYDTEYEKPSPELTNTALYDIISKAPSELSKKISLEGLGVAGSRKNIWFIGDSPIDVLCGYWSGCTPILFGDLQKEIASHLAIDYIEAADFSQLSEMYKNATTSKT